MCEDFIGRLFRYNTIQPAEQFFASVRTGNFELVEAFHMPLPKPPHAIRTLLNDGLSHKSSIETGVAATKYIIRLLGQKTPAANDAAVDFIRDIVKVSIQKQIKFQKIDCRAGCSFCCHTNVSVRAPEAFQIARSIRKRSNSSLRQRLSLQRELHLTLSSDERWALRTPCAFLENGNCSIYSIRPSMCQLYASVNVKACQSSFNGSDEDIPQPGMFIVFRSQMSTAFFAACRKLGYSCQGYELHQTIEYLLEHPDAEREWYSGSRELEKLSSEQDLIPDEMNDIINNLLSYL